MGLCLPSPVATGSTQAGSLPITVPNPQLGQQGGGQPRPVGCGLPIPALAHRHQACQTSVYEDLRNQGSMSLRKAASVFSKCVCGD